MYLHLGQDITICEREIIGIFDLDRCTTVGPASRRYLAEVERAGHVVNVSTGDLPKSFVVCGVSGSDIKETVYISPLSAETLAKRQKCCRLEGIYYEEK